MKRSPMSRGTGFTRRPPKTRTPARSEAACGLPSDHAAVEPQVPTTLARAARRGTYAAPPAAAAIPKLPRREIPHLLAMARGMPCLFGLSHVCNRNPETTVAAHSNWAQHGGKGGARKADDCYSAWACSACHSWLDSGSADGERKKVAFMLAHLSQVHHWRRIVADPASKPRDSAAAQLALEHLNATPVRQGEPG